MKSNYPARHQIPQLRGLWKEAFGDTDAFLDAFFEYGFDRKRCRCITDADAVVSALYWFEVTYRGQRFAYLYAVATALSHRGRGLFEALLEDTKQILAEEGFDGILLVPENEALCRMYEKFGFSACTTVETCRVSAGETAVAVREIGPETFAAQRRAMLPEDSVLQEGDILRFLASQYHFWAETDWLAVGQVYDGKLVCQEFLGDRNAISGLVRALGASVGQVRMPGSTDPFAWFLPLRSDCERPAYFALALD